MVEGALSDVVVLELATGVAGPYCGKLLADLGAQVIKVEPPGGDPLRGEYPLVDGESAFFNWLNGNKLGVELPYDDRRIIALATKADIIIHDQAGPFGDTLDAQLREANIHAVVLSVSPYGRSGDRANGKTSALTEYATSGFHYIAGDPAREPLALPGYQVEFHAGVHAGIAALAGLRHSRETGEGQLVEVSHQEATLSDHAWLTTIWTHQGKVQSRTGSLYAKCADGYVYLFNLVPYPNLFLLMERFDLLEDEELLRPLVWMERFLDVVFPAFAEWAATRTKREIYHAAQELRVAISPVNTMEDIANSDQLGEREWFEEVEVAGQRFKAPGFPYKLTKTPASNRTRAPKLGQDNEAVFGPHFEWANSEVERTLVHEVDTGATPAPRGPLNGIRVIEVTANWAGPIAGRHLADLGAEVIKIELASKPATRALIHVADDLWPEHWHRSGYFNKLNRNKKGVCLDLSKPAGKEVFLALVQGADIVLENNAARVMGQLGLAYDALRETNPRIVMCSMSGFGATGPERHYSAYGSNIETISGLASLLGYGPGEYFGTGSFYADPATGNHGVVAMLAALHARRRTDEGQWIDMALLEAVAPFFSQQFLEYTVEGRVPEPIANRHRVHAPQNVYSTVGRDCWLALTVRDEAEWAGLCQVIGREDLANDPGLQSAEGRRARQDEIDDAIRAWAAHLDHLAASEALQAAGVPAAPVMPNWEIFSDNHLNARDFFVRQRHLKAGTHWFPGFAWRFSRTPTTIERAAPLFGEHNHDVFAGVLGMSPEEIEKLYSTGVSCDHPVYANGPTL
ncbi:MAG: CoA transferase [Dehalococcoidia bacterium]|nr:CoA transferase [Dehalococcoidia bacterium]